MDASIPVVDLSLPEDQAAKVLHDACTNHGFFYLVNHGVDEALVQQVFSKMADFFRLPLQEKEKMAAKNNKGHVGYTTMREETLDPKLQTSGDTKEGVYIGRHVEPGSEQEKLPMHGVNPWPSEDGPIGDINLQGWRATMELYRDQVEAVGMRMVRLVALSLGLPGDRFAPYFTFPLIKLRLLHYAPLVSDPAHGLFAAGAHTDYGFITFLRTDDVPGLQIFTRDQQWHDVPPVPGAFICNIGNLLERWSNGKYVSTLHRVVNSTGRERYSVPMFFEPDVDALIECITEPGEDPKFQPITVQQHIENMYSQTHFQYKSQNAP